jgi:hypothetical protein
MKGHTLRLRAHYLIVGLVLVCFGCGGGGGGGGNGSPAANQGIFVDSAVGGLQYETPTQLGITNLQGTFHYQEGETITFSIGDIVLGQAVAKATMTPVDLVGGALIGKNPTVTNIARFLLSLDVDGNWENGISISEQIRNECLGRVIDFNQSIADFENDPDVQNLFDTLNALGVFPDVRALCPSTQAENHLQETVEDHMGKWVTTVKESDIGNDGTIDRVTNYTYDANGNLTKEEYDADNDGTIDEVTYYTYDANGNLIKEEYDADNDGTIDSVRYYTYDADGKRIKREEDEDNDGTIDEVAYYSYDANGNVIRVENDLSNDGDIDVVTYYTYDANGNVIEEFFAPVAGNPLSIKYYSYSYDANGNVLLKAIVEEQVGTFNRSSYTHDANGNVIKIEYDGGMDGTIDNVNYFTWERI